MDASCSDGEAECCYICLDGPRHGAPLLRPCACVWGAVHAACLARWQLQSAGRDEESICRFCRRCLPSWRAALEGASAAPGSELPAPVMSIQFHGSTYYLQVQHGDGGVEQFKADVRRLLGLSEEQSFDITFECRVPGDESRMELRGLRAYDAAVYCASLTAAERLGRVNAAADGGSVPACDACSLWCSRSRNGSSVSLAASLSSRGGDDASSSQLSSQHSSQHSPQLSSSRGSMESAHGHGTAAGPPPPTAAGRLSRQASGASWQSDDELDDSGSDGRSLPARLVAAVRSLLRVGA